ncbi:Leucine-rich repeat transmembrane protein flrt1 [Mactra antiquata]
MAAHAPAILLFFTSLLMTSYAQTGPTGCTYVDGIYDCDYSSLTSPSDRPLDYSQFSVEPQNIELTVSGFLPYFGDASVFSSGFDTIDEATLNVNSPASLVLKCEQAASIYMQTETFLYMSHVQHVAIQDCNCLYLPASVFEELVSLDYLSFQRGIIDDVEAMTMYDMSIEKLSTSAHKIPRNLGRFEVVYAKFAGKAVPPGFLYNWKNLTSVALVGADIETLTSDTFLYTSKIRYIDVSDNSFTVLPSGMFDNLNSLSEVKVYNIEWSCSCTDNWFVDYATTNNINMYGDFMCSNVEGSSVWKYYNDNCLAAKLCDGTIGIVLLNKCLTLFAMLAFGCGFVALVVFIVCLGLIICMRKQNAQKGARRSKARSRWNKVMDVGVKMKTKKK